MSKLAFITATLPMFAFRAFDPGKAGWKMTADGKSIEMKDGNPVWIDDNGGERVMEGGTIGRLNGEARTLRERAEKAEKDLKVFEGIDAKAAREAIDTVKKIDQKKLIDAGEVDRVKQEIRNEMTQQMNALQDENKTLRGTLDNNLVDGVFTGSEFVRDKVAVPADMFQATFRNNFKVKDGKLEAYDKSGNRIMSKVKIGEYAEPGEALEILVDQHPQKATILRASGHSGSGNNGDAGGHRPGVKIIKRADFDQLSPPNQAAYAAQANKGEIAIID